MRPFANLDLSVSSILGNATTAHDHAISAQLAVDNEMEAPSPSILSVTSSDSVSEAPGTSTGRSDFDPQGREHRNDTE